MTVSIDSVTQTGLTTYQVGWSSNLPDPTFYVYQDGVLLNTTKAGSGQFSVPTGESLVLEVLDDLNETPEAAFPGKLTLGWYAVTDTDFYRIDEYAGAAWVQRAVIRETGRGFYQWKSRFLEDVTVHQFRVVPVGTNGNDGDPLAFNVLMVRHPDAPAVGFSYSSGTGKVTIS